MGSSCSDANIKSHVYRCDLIIVRRSLKSLKGINKKLIEIDAIPNRSPALSRHRRKLHLFALKPTPNLNRLKTESKFTASPAKFFRLFRRIETIRPSTEPEKIAAPTETCLRHRAEEVSLR